MQRAPPCILLPGADAPAYTALAFLHAPRRLASLPGCGVMQARAPAITAAAPPLHLPPRTAAASGAAGLAGVCIRRAFCRHRPVFSFAVPLSVALAWPSSGHPRISPPFSARSVRLRAELDVRASTWAEVAEMGPWGALRLRGGGRHHKAKEHHVVRQDKVARVRSAPFIMCAARNSLVVAPVRARPNGHPSGGDDKRDTARTCMYPRAIGAHARPPARAHPLVRTPARSYAGQVLKSLDKQRKDPKLKKQKKIRFRPGTREGVPFRGYDRTTPSGTMHSLHRMLLC